MDKNKNTRIKTISKPINTQEIRKSAETSTGFVQNRVSRITGLYERTRAEYAELLVRKDDIERKLKHNSRLSSRVKHAIISAVTKQPDKSKLLREELCIELVDVKKQIIKKEQIYSNLETTLAEKIASQNLLRVWMQE